MHLVICKICHLLVGYGIGEIDHRGKFKVPLEPERRFDKKGYTHGELTHNIQEQKFAPMKFRLCPKNKHHK
jgi:hypothetical protein